jgi:PAS domain S-box-containing protein
VKVRRAKKRAPSLPGSAAGLLKRLRQAERRLREVEERHEIAMGAINESVYDWDIAEDSVYFSDGMERVLSLPPDALRKSFKDWHERIHPDDFARYREATVAHLKGATKHFECDYRYRALDGTWHWARTHGLAIRNRQGRAIRMIGSTGDITELKERERELAEQRAILESTLEQQQATTEILKATLSSPTGVEPVFQAILTNASRLCEASFAGLFLYEGGLLRNVARQSASAEFAQVLLRMRAAPSRETTTRRCALERRTIHTEDLLNDPEFSPPEPQRRENVRTALSVPMLREGVLFGVITLWRAEVRPFTDRQIALVETFADQALIALENVRLFNETKEALERQTATAEILRVISSSPTDTQPVFDAIVQGGLKLFSGAAISVALPDGDMIRAAAVAESDPGRAQAWRNRFPFPLARDYMHGVSILACRVVDVPDVENAPVEWAAGSRNFLASGYRAITIMPMMRGGAAIGALSVVRLAPGPLSEKQLAVLKTFADQAVIAIENVRLLNETKEALERQTATSEVLRVISSSPNDLQSVFDAILENATRICEAQFGTLLLYDGAQFHAQALHKVPPAFAEALRREPRRAGPTTGLGRLVATKRPVHIHDLAAEGAYAAREPMRVQTVELGGVRTALVVPLLKGDDLLGGLQICRHEVKPFSEKQIGFVCTFADQAVIAIENARLFHEIQEKSRQLEIANRHKSEFLANMSHELRTPLNAIIGFTRIVMRRSQEQLEPKQYENLEKILSSGQNLLALINAILDLSKVEAGRVEVNAVEIALAPVLDQCLRTVEPLVRAESVTLLREFDGAPPQMYADEEKLRQIVINLLSNAAKFTASGSIRLEARAANGSVDIAVADTGIGIPADKLDVIFEEFEQADASSTRVHGGTGLGLTIARRLARLMGGDIRARSTPGSGSTFTLTLPVRYAA